MNQKYYIWYSSRDFWGRFVRFIKYELEKRGDSVEISNDTSKNDRIWLLTYEAFVVNFDVIDKKYIAIQTENLTARLTPKYKDFLDKAEEVWDYSSNFRIGYSEFWELEKEEFKDIDVLFFGTINKRREEILKRIENIYAVDKVFGIELQRLIDRSKIVLSVHHYENPNNDMARLAPLISNRVFVVAEKFNDARYEYLKDKFVVTETEKLNEVCQYYLANPIERIKWVEKSYNWIKNEYNTTF